MNEITQKIYRRMVVFGAGVIRLANDLHRTDGGRIVAKQVCRSATSIGANYRESQRARTKAEFVSKLHISLQEADETVHWLELIREAGLAPPQQVAPLLEEANEFASIIVVAARTANNRR